MATVSLLVTHRYLQGKVTFNAIENGRGEQGRAVFVFTDSVKPIADIDATRGKGCHTPLFPALP